MRKFLRFAAFFLLVCAGLLLPTGCASKPEVPPIFLRVWHPVEGPDTAELFLNPHGRAGGFTGNNRFFAPAVFGEEGKLSFGALMITRQEGRHGEFEAKYLRALGAVRSYRCDGETLVFFDADGNEVMRFRGGARFRRREEKR